MLQPGGRSCKCCNGHGFGAGFRADPFGDQGLESAGHGFEASAEHLAALAEGGGGEG